MMGEPKTISDNVIRMTKWAGRADAWMNFVTGQGVPGRDKTRHDFFSSPRDFTQHELEDLYRGDAIAQRIVDTLPNDMTRAGFQVKIANETDDGDGIEPGDVNRIAAWVQKRFRELRGPTKVKRGLRWDRLYGGSLAVLFIDDGQDDLSKPVNVNAIKKIENLHILHRFQVTEGPQDTDPRSKNFGQAEFYTITGPNVAADGMEVVHADRVLRFQDVDLPDDVRRRQFDRFGDSVFVRSWEALSDFQMAYRAVAGLVADFSQAVWGIPHLHELVMAKREELIQRRIAIQDFARSTVNAVMVDPQVGETFTRVATPVGGLSELLDRLGIRLSAATGMPITLLLGIGPKGFSTDDQSGQANWDDVVSAKQEDNLLEQLLKLIGYLFHETGSPTGGAEPETWGIEFNPLVQQDAGEQATTEKTIAEKDVIYINAGVITPSEVRASRFTADGFSLETTLDPEVSEAMAESDREKAIGEEEEREEPPPVMPPPPGETGTPINQGPPLPPGPEEPEGDQ